MTGGFLFMGKQFGEKIIIEVLEMKTKGLSNREIGKKFNLSMKQIERLVTRYNRKQKNTENGVISKPKGRPRKTSATSEHKMELRIKELEREVELYKSFLHAVGRM